MDTYTDFNEIEKDLKKLKLQNKIAKEELKIVKYEIEEFLKPLNWVTTILKSVGKYGLLVVIKKVFR